MAAIGFHASHEQISPGQLLKDVRLAEEAGFDAAMCSDHIEPWTARQGHSDFAGSWLGAALATTGLGFGVVTAQAQKLTEMLAAYRSGGGKGKAVLQIHLSWAPRDEDAVAIALDQWRSNVFAPPIPWEAPFIDAFADSVLPQLRKVPVA